MNAYLCSIGNVLRWLALRRVVLMLAGIQTICVQASLAQPFSNKIKWDLTLGGGFQHASFLDEQAGQVLFTGNSFAAEMAVRCHSPNSETQIGLSGGPLRTSTTGNIPHTAAGVVANITIRQLFLFGEPQQKVRLGIGGTLDGLYAARRIADLINSGRFVDFGTSIDAALVVKYDSDPEDLGWHISELVETSLIGISQYSRYNRQYQTGNTGMSSKESDFSPLQWGLSDRWLRLVNTLQIGKKLTPRSTAGLQYRWNFYRLETRDLSRQAVHQFVLYYNFVL